MKPLWRNVEFLLAAIFAVLFSGLSVVLALFMMMTVDSAVEGNLSSMFIYLALTIGLALAEFIIGVIFRHFSLTYIRKSVEISKNNLYLNMVQGTDFSSEENIAMYSTNTDIIYTKYYQNHVLIILFGTQFIFSVIGVIYLNWILFLVSFCVSMLPAFAPVIFQKRLKRTIENYSNASKDYIDFVQDSNKGVYEIKSFFAQGFFEKMHSALNRSVEKARAGNKMVNYLMDRTSNLLGSFSFIAIIGVGGFLVVRGQMTIGVMIAVIQLLNSMVSPIGELSTRIGEMSSSKSLAHEYLKDVVIEEGVSTLAFLDRITLDRISYSYSQDSGNVLSSFSAQFKKGCAYAITGESGCGKTTLAKIIAGLINISEGKALYDDLDINKMNKSSYMSKVRYIDQSAHLFNLNVSDNIEMGRTGDCQKFLGNLGLREINGCSSVDELSGGQKQRIILARALNMLPDVLILDEPTASLDVETSLSTIKYLREFDGLTLIVITHSNNEELLSLFDDVIKL